MKEESSVMQRDSFPVGRRWPSGSGMMVRHYRAIGTVQVAMGRELLIGRGQGTRRSRLSLLPRGGDVASLGISDM
jgi:hypothetical protein